jgi:hypothetical protein
MNCAFNNAFLCRKMSPHRPTTQQSPNIPKGKSIQAGEASSSTIVEELEPVPKVELVI